MTSLDPADAEALATFLAALHDPDRILATWRAKELFHYVDNDALLLSRGSAGSPEVGTVARRYVESVGRPLPPLLLAFLAAHNGYSIEPQEGAGITVVDGDGFDVAEPLADSLLPARHLESDETDDMEHSGILIGKSGNECRVILIDEGELAGTVVFEDGEGTVVLAPTLATFFHELAAHGLSVGALWSAKDTRFSE